jgi:hypothetical protein
VAAQSFVCIPMDTPHSYDADESILGRSTGPIRRATGYMYQLSGQLGKIMGHAK